MERVRGRMREANQRIVMYDALGLPEERKNFDKLGGLHGAVLGFRRGSRAYRS